MAQRHQSKRKGSRRELETVDTLKSLNFACTKAGGSFGRWDIIAIDNDRVLLIQVKSNRWPPQAELAKLMEGPVPGFCSRLIFRFDDRMPLRVAAMSVGQDGKVLIHEIQNSVYTQAHVVLRSTQRATIKTRKTEVADGRTRNNSAGARQVVGAGAAETTEAADGTS